MFKKSFSIFNFYSKRCLSLKNNSGFDWAQQEKLIMKPMEYIQKTPSKHQSLIAPAFNYWLQIPNDKLDAIQDIMEILSAWVILLDDIQDDSAVRYGVPAAHRVFGVGLTINAANKAVFQAQKQVEELGHPLAKEVFLKGIDDHFLAQGVDLYWRDQFECPSEEALMEMMKKKSLSFVFPVELSQLFSTNKNDHRELAFNLGLFYYTLDDYYNLFDPKGLEKLAVKKQENHTSCSDITEGKQSLAVVHASQFPDVATELAEILKQRTTDRELKNRAVSLLKKHGSDVYVRDVLRKIEADIRTEIVRLGGNPHLTKFMDSLSF